MCLFGFTAPHIDFIMSESSTGSTLPPNQERRSCPNCSTRMSSRSFDSHFICIKCRGIKCTFDIRCDVCKSWDDDTMNAYLKHQKVLDSKRKAKKKRASDDDFAVACTGVVGSTPPADGIMAGDEGSIEAGSSVSGVSQADVQAMVDSRLAEHNAQLDSRFDAFAVSFAKIIRGEIKTAIDDRLSVNNPSISAPQTVPCQPNPAVQPAAPLRNPQSGNECPGEDARGRVLSENLDASLPHVLTSQSGAAGQLVNTLRGMGVHISEGIAGEDPVKVGGK